ncbi:hypothetical protein SCB49_12679 [unidentified eubacterium SCB49]|nr:hypothetical protein SCB49_12679 [unidentified eubacterium SCB49]
MQIPKQFYFLLIFILQLGGISLYAQDPAPKDAIILPAEIENDTINPAEKTLPTTEKLEEGVVKTDTIRPPKEDLKHIVDYYGEDYVYLDKKNNRAYMYNKAYVIYGDTRIDAGEIILDYNTNEIYARGIDSAGVYLQKPVFVQGMNKVEPDSLRFNNVTEKAIVYNSRTQQSGFNVIAEITKKQNDSVIFLKNVKFTTSENIDDPDYYFFTRRAKFVPNRKIVTGLTNMYIADVPTPIALPFGYFPLTEDRASGFILPSYGDNNNGFSLQNGGYYFNLSDYIDLTLIGDYATNGSYALRGETNYALRYKFSGNLSLRYENNITSERGFDDFSQSSIYNIRWSHTQDAKVNPSSRFSANVNLGSSKYFQESQNETNNASALVNTLSSSISYSKTFDIEPQVNISLAATHSQNTQTEAINMSLPNFNGSIARIYPFAPKVGTKQGIIDNINVQYNVTAENRISTVDSLFFKPEMFNSAQIGARHSIPVSTNFKILDYLSASMSTSYQETWVLKTINRRYDYLADDNAGAVIEDTIPGFDSYRTYNFSTSLGTTVYGTFNRGEDKKIQGLRHVMRPSISYSINPAFDQYYDEYEVYTPATADEAASTEIVEYSRFENTLYGAPGKTFTSSIGLSLSNTLEAKVRSKDSTATEAKKVTILNNLNFATAYNVAGDSLKLSPLTISGSIPLVDKLDINLRGTLNPYALDNNNTTIDVWNIENGGSLFRLTDANISLNYSFSSKDLEGANNKDQEQIDNDTFRNGGRQDDLFGESTSRIDGSIFEDKDESDYENKEFYNFSIPWDFRLAYTMTYSNNQRQDEISSQSLMFSSNLDLSPRWRVGVSSGYDFKNKGVTLTQFRFQRDLESWQMSFNWTPIGSINTSWYFFIGIKSSILSDIKYDKRRVSDRSL